jgi:hypothetical protein
MGLQASAALKFVFRELGEATDAEAGGAALARWAEQVRRALTAP